MRMSSEELSEWMAYARLEPFGENQSFYRTGIISSTIANCFRSKGQKPFKPQDFMPQPVNYDLRNKRQSPEHIKTMFMGLSKLFGKKKGEGEKKNG